MSAPRDRLDDDALASHLERRASRAHLAGEDRERIIAAATAVRSVRPTGMRWNLFSAPIAAALVVALVIGVTVVGSIPSGPAAPTGGTVPVSGSASAAPFSAQPRLEGLRVITPGEVEALLAAPSERGLEQVVAADVTIDVGTESQPPCHPDGVCLIGHLRLPVGPLPIHAAEEVRVGLTPGELTGWLGLSIAPPGVGPRLTLLGPVQPGEPGLSSTVPDVLARAESIDAGDLMVVEGWLVRGGDGNIRCGRPDDDPMDGPFRCEPTDWLAESPDEPVLADDGSGWLRMTGPALTVQPNATGTFARYDPEADRPPEPRLEAFLVQATEDVSIGCGGCQQWRILGRIDAAGPPEPAEASQPGEALHPLVVRAGSALPDANVPLPQALSLVATVTKWLIPWDIENGTSWADRPLAPARVAVASDRARVVLHDYGDGRTVLVLLKMAGGEPTSLVDVTISEGSHTTLSAWEEDEARRVALESTQASSLAGAVARDVRAGPCTVGPGRCAIVGLFTDDSVDPSRRVTHVIVDIGRQRVVRELPVPTSPLAATPPPP